MRLEVLRSGHREAAAAALEHLKGALDIDTPPGVVATMLYRPEFFGQAFANYLHDCSRGESDWSVGERELFAALVSKLNQCPW
ncbi:MAG: hypothetical protein ACR2OD_11590 [Gaiellaceae bacterium]